MKYKVIYYTYEDEVKLGQRHQKDFDNFNDAQNFFYADPRRSGHMCDELQDENGNVLIDFFELLFHKTIM